MTLAESRAEFLEESQRVMEETFPGLARLGSGQPFPVSRSGDDRTEEAEEGGYEESVAVTIRVRKKFLPKEGVALETLIELNDRAMRVTSCLLEPGDVAWWVELETE